MIHAANLVLQKMFLFGQDFPNVNSWAQLGNVTYYFFILIRQIPTFAVPTFFFVSGFFISYTYKNGKDANYNFRVLLIRLKYLLIPYLIWSLFIILGDYVLGNIQTPFQYLLAIFTVGVTPTYWFIPCLCFFYLTSPFLVFISKNHWKLLLIIIVVIQLSSFVIFYFPYLGINLSGYPILSQITAYYSPLNSLLFFAFGIIFGDHPLEFKKVLNPFKKAFIFIGIFLLIISIFETDFLIRINRNIHIGAFNGTFSFTLYSFIFLLFLITHENLPKWKPLSQIGDKIYGIYLLHIITIIVFDKVINVIFPQITNEFFIVYFTFLVAFGLGVPILLMSLVASTPLKKYYQYFFG